MMARGQLIYVYNSYMYLTSGHDERHKTVDQLVTYDMEDPPGQLFTSKFYISFYDLHSK